jgi:hypothetical protein
LVPTPIVYLDRDRLGRGISRLLSRRRDTVGTAVSVEAAE